MPKGVRITVDISKYVELLRSLPVKIQRKAVMSALRDASRFLVKALKARTPRRTGATRKAIKAGRVKQSGPVFEVGIRRPIIFNILESGARAHEITSPQKKALVFGGISVTKVQHPGFPGIGPIFDTIPRENEPAVMRVFREKIELVIDEAEAAAR